MKYNALIIGILVMVFAQGAIWAQEDAATLQASEEDEVAGNLEEPAIDGEALFKTFCSSCHHPTQRLVGPVLEGIRERRDSAWIINFVRSSQSMIEEGDSVANAVFMEFNQVPMPDHPNLTDEQINAIIDFANAPQEEIAADQPISRPDLPPKPLYKPIQFTSFTFWIIYTATVFMIIGWLYYMIEYTEIIKKATGNKEGDQEVPFGEQ